MVLWQPLPLPHPIQDCLGVWCSTVCRFGLDTAVLLIRTAPLCYANQA